MLSTHDQIIFFQYGQRSTVPRRPKIPRSQQTNGDLQMSHNLLDEIDPMLGSFELL